MRKVSISKIATKIGSGSTPRGGKSSYLEEGVPFIRSQNVQFGRLKLDNIAFIGEDVHQKMKRTQVRPGDVLLNITGASIGRSAVVTDDVPVANVNQHVCIIRVDASNYIPQFLSEFLNSRKGQYMIDVAQSGGSRQGLNFQEVGGLKIPNVELSIQEKIVEILSDCDAAIKCLELRIKKGEQQNNGFCSALITRAEGNSPQLFAMSELTTRITRKNDGGSYPVMTISGRNGFLLQSDKYSRDMAGSSLSNYTLLEHGEFAYNKGNSKAFPQGCVYRLNEESAVVPFVYISFALKSSFNSDFYNHLFASGYLSRQLSRQINSGVRNDGLLNINPSDFFNCKVPVPPLQEQAEIAHVLNELETQNSLLSDQLDCLKQQKQGLIQELLTGKLRVTRGRHE